MALATIWFTVSMLCLAQAVAPPPSNWAGFWGVLPATIAAIASGIGVVFGVINAKKTQKIVVKTDEMEKQGNSRWTEQQNKLDAALRELSEQKALVQRFMDKGHEDTAPPEKRSHHRKD